MKKNKKVSQVRHVCGITTDIMLNPNSLEFYASPVDGVVFTDRDASLLRGKVAKYLDESVKLIWVPVISIKETAPFAAADYAFLGIELDRFYVGKSGSGDLRSLRWDDMIENELERVQISKRFYGFTDLILPHHSEERQDSITHYLAHSEPVWASLNQIREGIARLKERLRDTVSSDAGIKRLESFGLNMQKLLEVPSDDKSKQLPETAK